MAAERSIGLQFPLGGLDKSTALQSQPPFTAPVATNVRPRTGSDGRLRGGSRPGLSKVWSTQLGSGNPVNLLATVRTGRPGTEEFLEDFEDALSATQWGKEWLAALPQIHIDGYAYPNVTSQIQGAVLQSGANATINPTASYTLSLQVISRGTGLGVNSNFYLYWGLDDTTPDGAQNCIYASLNTSNGLTALTVYKVVSGTLTSLGSASNAANDAGTLSVVVTGSTAVATFGSLTVNATWDHALAGDSVGFALMDENTATADCTAGEFRLNYTPPAAALPNTVVAASNGTVSYVNTSNALATATGSFTVGTGRLLQAVDRAGVLYIADSGPYVAAATDGVFSGGTTFDSNTYTDWRSVCEVGDILWVYDATTAGNEREYVITAIEATAGTSVTVSPAAANNEGSLSFRVLRGPKRFTPATGVIDSWATAVTAGQVPGGCPLIAAWSDRIVLGGGDVDPAIWYMSRQGDPLDWDYGAALDIGDPGKAVAGTSAFSQPQFGAPLTAIVPLASDSLLFATENSMWILRGDPGYGGRVVNLSHIVGIVSRGAWCHGPDGGIFFMARDGVYYLAPGGGSLPQPVSRTRLPADMRDIDPAVYVVAMAYDAADQGVHVFVSPAGPTATTHYWLDWSDAARGTWWAVTLSSDHDPMAIAIQKNIGSGVSDVVLGCRDGYLRAFRHSAANDDGTGITRTLRYAPLRVGGPMCDGRIVEIVGTLGEDSGAVGWALFTGDTAESAVDEDTWFSRGTWTAGLNAKLRPRCRAAYVCLELSSSVAWTVEGIDMVLQQAGKTRVH